MGWLRLFLALSVLAGHGGTLFGYVGVGGPIAVQAFYIVSGFYMALVLDEKYRGPGQWRTFYLARAVRIYGVYWPIAALYFAVFAVRFALSGSGPLAAILEQGAGSGSWTLLVFANVFLFGLDVTQFLAFDGRGLAWTVVPPVSGRLRDGILVPPAWSLGLELIFYVLAPIVLRRRPAVLVAIAVTCLAGRVFAWRWWGLADDPWSFRFFPFELTHFLMGALAYAWLAARPREAGVADRWVVGVLAAGLAVIPLLAPGALFGSYFEGARLALLGLVAVALPSLFRLSNSSRVDRIIGELSYPVYLLHWLLYSVVIRIPGIGADSVWTGPALAVLTLAAAAVFELAIGRHLERFRAWLIARRLIPRSE